MQKYFSSGKLMLTSEYMVLDGAVSLAVPTHLGQELFVEENEGEGFIFWEALHEGKEWLSIKICSKTWAVLDTNLPENAQFILKTLRNLQELSKGKIEQNKNYHLKTNLQFPANFGLGSSSTLMANLAKWARIDAFSLNELSLGGSGYDVAVAMENSAICYQLKDNQKLVERVSFNPKFKKDLILIHLNQKQDSREGIRLYRGKERSEVLISQFSALTDEVLKSETLEEFSIIMETHERLLSEFLGLETAKQKHFPDCPSFIKSLGAWGGDFVLASKFEGYRDYFAQKGFFTIFDYDEIVKN